MRAFPLKSSSSRKAKPRTPTMTTHCGRLTTSIPHPLLRAIGTWDRCREMLRTTTTSVSGRKHVQRRSPHAARHPPPLLLQKFPLKKATVSLQSFYSVTTSRTRRKDAAAMNIFLLAMIRLAVPTAVNGKEATVSLQSFYSVTISRTRRKDAAAMNIFLLALMRLAVPTAVNGKEATVS